MIQTAVFSKGAVTVEYLESLPLDKLFSTMKTVAEVAKKMIGV